MANEFFNSVKVDCTLLNKKFSLRKNHLYVYALDENSVYDEFVKCLLERYKSYYPQNFQHDSSRKISVKLTAEALAVIKEVLIFPFAGDIAEYVKQLDVPILRSTHLESLKKLPVQEALMHYINMASLFWDKEKVVKYFPEGDVPFKERFQWINSTHEFIFHLSPVERSVENISLRKNKSGG